MPQPIRIAPDGLPVVGKHLRRSVLAVAESALRDGSTILSYDWDGVPPTDPDAACAWLLGNIDGDTWHHPYAAFYGTRPGWASAHSHAQALRVLARAGSYQPGLLRPLTVDIEDGGLADGAWLEKFAQPGVTPSRVLNGMLFALDALHDVHERTGEGRSIITRGMSSLRASLPRYDLDGWSAYDGHGKRAPEWYHQVHVRLLDRLHDLTGQVTLATWRDRWS